MDAVDGHRSILAHGARVGWGYDPPMIGVTDAGAHRQGLTTGPGDAAAPADGQVLDPVVQPQCSLAVQLRRVSGSVVGRTVELSAMGAELENARSRLSAVCLEGEPGIGKTRLLIATSEMAATMGFTVVAVTADEEIRGPFLLARSILASADLREATAGTSVEPALRRADDAVSGRAEAGLGSLAPEARLLRAYDQSAVALAAAAGQRPLALLVDDIQWADDDSLRMLRYVVRTLPASPIFLLVAIRPEEIAQVTEAVNFLADMERMGVVRRLRLARFTQLETGALLRQVLGGSMDPASAATMHAQAEGVPFIVEEVARAYRESGLVQQVSEVWTLVRNADRLVPSAVRTLIQRRAARLPDETRDVMADAALLGRSFSLRDLHAIRARLGEEGREPSELADALASASEAGLLLEHGEPGPADYTFTHEQVRDFAAARLSHARRRRIHAAIVDLLAGDGSPDPASLSLLAQHALGAGDTRRAAGFSIGAATAALDANAPEEALRVVEQALPAVSSPQERRALLTARDDAYAMARRPVERLEGLAELAALAEAMRDSHLELEVMLRRSAALRLAHEDDAAVELARRVGALAASREDRPAELAAWLELGQAIMHSPVGESYTVSAIEVDFDAAEEAFRLARGLAAELGDEPNEAAATRELGVITVSRVRAWFVEQLQAGRGAEFARRIASGETVKEVLATIAVAPLLGEADVLFTRALEIYERLGDRRGVMSTVIAMAFINHGAVIHLASSARHIEEIRRVTQRMSAMVTESERARADLQMLYGVQVYALAKVVPDLALARGEDAYRSARVLGDRSIELLAAGGMVLAHVQLGELDEAERWLDRASAAASSAPTPVRARQVETWRGIFRSAAGDFRGMRTHLESAVQMAADQGRAAARCEALARLALESARCGVLGRDEELLHRAERAALEAKDILPILSGHAPWGAQADAAISQVALARGDIERAVAAASTALQALEDALHEDMNLDVLLPAAAAILAGGPPKAQAEIREWLQIQSAGIAQRTLDEDIRVRWLRGPVGRELARLAGPIEGLKTKPSQAKDAQLSGLVEGDADLLRLLMGGETNREIADGLGISEEAVARRLGEVFVRIGASSRAEATSFAFRGNLL
jgi:DNA-binding NarL/FixJ family response regulator